MDMKKSFYDEVILFEVDDAGAAVGFETGFLDGIVERAGIAHLLEGEFGVRLVRCDQSHGADPENTIEQAPAHFQIDHPKHVDIVYPPIQDPSTELDPVGDDFVVDHLQLERFIEKNEHDQQTQSEAYHQSVPSHEHHLSFGEF